MSISKKDDNMDWFDRAIDLVAKIVENIPHDLPQNIKRSFNEGFKEDPNFKNKKQIYQNIAIFLNKKFQEDKTTCLNSAYIIFNETSSEFIDKNAFTQKSYELAEKAEKYLIAVKIHYVRKEKSDIYSYITEIFSTNLNDNKKVDAYVTSQ